MRKGTISNVAYGFGAAIIRPECATILRSKVSNKNEVRFKMGYCGKCGAKMEDNEWVCGKCGMPRNAAANTYQPAEPIFSDSPNDPTPSRTEKKKKVKPLVGVVAFMIAGLVSYFGVGAVLNSTSDKSASTQVSTESWKPLVDSNDSGGGTSAAVTEPEVEYERGILTDTTYESKFIGLRFKASGNWVLLSADEAKKQSSEACEMMATCASVGGTIQIATEELITDKITVDNYIDSVKEQLVGNADVVKSGVKVTSFDKIGTENILDDEYTAAIAKMKIKGIDAEQKWFLRKKKDRMICIAISYLSGKENAIKESLALLEKY